MQIPLWMRLLAAALVVLLVQQSVMRLVVVTALLLGVQLVVQLVLQSARMNILITHMHRRKSMPNMHPIGADIHTGTIAHPAREKKVAVDRI
jgi:Flp pilus assembly protein protease CpaA